MVCYADEHLRHFRDGYTKPHVSIRPSGLSCLLPEDCAWAGGGLGKTRLAAYACTLPPRIENRSDLSGLNETRRIKRLTANVCRNYCDSIKDTR